MSSPSTTPSSGSSANWRSISPHGTKTIGETNSTVICFLLVTEMKVKIKQIAEAYHITRKGLHFYEEKGIVNPVRDENNSYMSLDIEDIYSIFRCRAYQKYGFSIKEISNIDKMYSLPEMREMLYSKYCTLQQEIQDKQRSADVILRQA